MGFNCHTYPPRMNTAKVPTHYLTIQVLHMFPCALLGGSMKNPHSSKVKLLSPTSIF